MEKEKRVNNYKHVFEINKKIYPKTQIFFQEFITDNTINVQQHTLKQYKAILSNTLKYDDKLYNICISHARKWIV